MKAEKPLNTPTKQGLALVDSWSLGFDCANKHEASSSKSNNF